MTAADWTPRELRHSFVSLLSDSGVPIKKISRLVGHSTAVIEQVYRHQIRPSCRLALSPWTTCSGFLVSQFDCRLSSTVLDGVRRFPNSRSKSRSG